MRTTSRPFDTVFFPDMRRSPAAGAAPEKRPAILVFRSAALGDFVLAAPAFRMLRLAYPGHRIVLLSLQSANRAIRESVAKYSPTHAMPWVELVVPHLVDEVVAFDGRIAPTALWNLRARLGSHRFAAAILFLDPGAPWAGRIKKLLLLTLLIGPIPIFGWRAKGSLNGDRAALKRAGLLPHHVHGPLHFLEELSPPRAYGENDVRFDLRPNQQALDWARAWVQQVVPSAHRIVFVAPGSIQPHKRWPLEAFAKLCAALLVRFDDIFLVIIGTMADRDLGAELLTIEPRRMANLAGATDVPQCAAVFTHGSLLVGNDGGAMHLGDAMGCPVVSIVPGIQYPDSIEPWNSRRLAVRHDVPCAPCYSMMSCPLVHNRCMRDLPLDRVLKNCLAVLEPARSRASGKS